MVPDGWKDVTLGDLVTLQRGHDLPGIQRKLGNVPVLGSFGVTGFHNEAKTRGPGVTVGRSGASIGVATFTQHDYWPLNTALYVIDFHGNDEKFAYYFLKHMDLARYNSGSAQPSLNRNYIHPLPICIPPLPEQKAIAHILGALDDKIELNRQMNQTLEAMAQAIFKSWFVDFDPVRAKPAQSVDRRSQVEGSNGEPYPLDAETLALFPDRFVDSELGEIPEGWGVKPLDKIAHYQNGLALQKYPPEGDKFLPVIKIRELRQGSHDARSGKASPNIKDSCIIEDGDVIFSWSGSLLVDLWCGGRGALNQHLFKVTSDRYPKWFYYFWTKHHLEEFQRIAADKATTMGHIKRQHLSQAQTFVPSQPIMRAASKQIAPLLDLHVQNNMQSRTLAELRDTLLPKLISGELRVPEVEENF